MFTSRGGDTLKEESHFLQKLRILTVVHKFSLKHKIKLLALDIV